MEFQVLFSSKSININQILKPIRTCCCPYFTPKHTSGRGYTKEYINNVEATRKNVNITSCRCSYADATLP